ncbi:MAG: STAS-like domain-containing protein [Candidatus Poribacteria bacterium]|nr:STAS-like domain-containing protein [Candidatus Poribacteria bacterium]
MSEHVHISTLEVVGSPFCVASSDGQKICDHLTAALKADRSIALSFRNVSTLTAVFLNAAIGQLYGIFSEEQIRSRLKVVDVEQDGSALLNRVVETAKLYFKDPQRFDQVVQEIMEDEA